MPNQELARPYDAVFSALEPQDIDKLHFKTEALLPASEKLIELNPSQRRLLGEALLRRTQAASESKRVQTQQIITASLFESGDEGFIDSTLLVLKDETSLEGLSEEEKVEAKSRMERDYNLVADTILGFKRKLTNRPASRRATSPVGPGEISDEMMEEAADAYGMGVDQFRQWLESDPQAMQMFGGAEGMPRRDLMNFYSIKYLIEQGFDSQKAWDIFRKAFTLFSIPGGLDEVTYGKLMNEDWAHPTSENEEMVRRVQAWQLMVDLLAVRSGPYSQPAQVAHREYSTLGILGSTYPAIMMVAAQKVEAFAQEINWSTEEVAEHLVKVTATGNELSSLIHGARKSVVFEARGGRRGSFELSVPGAMDQFVGNRARIVTNEQGAPLYSFHGHVGEGNGAPVIDLEGVPLSDILGGLTAAQKEYVLNSEGLVPVWDRELTGRVVEGQQLYTWTDTMKAEKGKEALVDWVVRQIESQGIQIEDLETFWATGEDGQQLTKDHDVYRLRYQRARGEWKERLGIVPLQPIIDRYIADGAPPAWAKHMAEMEFDPELDRLARRDAAMNLIADAAITAYGRYADLGFGIIDMLGQAELFDVRQLLDNLPELTNKAMAGFSYDEKYAILPAAMRKMVQSYLRTVLAWKRKEVDPVLVSLYGKKGVTAAWRDPLGPEKAPFIPEVRLKDGRRLSQLKGSAAMITVGGVEMLERDLYVELTTTVEALFYLKSDWRSGSGQKQDRANHLLLLSQQRGGDQGQVQAMLYFDEYIKDFNDMAPQEFPRARDEVALLLQALVKGKRASLNMLNWKGVLKAFGYDNMGLDEVEYTGMQGLAKLVELRSSGQWLTGEIQKMFKYMSKYPGLAVAETKALTKIVPTLNNALHPLYESLLGGMPDRMEDFKADQVGEALAKAMVNVMFMGTRSQKAAGAYIKEVIESTIEAASLIGYMSGAEQRKNVADIVMAIDTFCDKAVDLCEYQYSGGDGLGEHGSSRAWLEIKESDPEKEADIVRSLRMAGFTVIYPNGSVVSDVDLTNLLRHGEITEDMLPHEGLTQAELNTRRERLHERLRELGELKPRRPYVSWGVQPQYLESGTTLSPDGSRINSRVSKQKVLGEYGHLGKEVLMTIILMEYLQDKLLMTELDSSRVLVDLVKKRGGNSDEAQRLWGIYKNDKERMLKELQQEQERQEELERVRRPE